VQHRMWCERARARRHPTRTARCPRDRDSIWKFEPTYLGADIPQQRFAVQLNFAMPPSPTVGPSSRNGAFARVCFSTYDESHACFSIYISLIYLIWRRGCIVSVIDL
jgi:hypothetical protein